jgi:hypothetical protein
MRRSTVLNVPPQLVFPGWGFTIKFASNLPKKFISSDDRNKLSECHNSIIIFKLFMKDHFMSSSCKFLKLFLLNFKSRFVFKFLRQSFYSLVKVCPVY